MPPPLLILLLCFSHLGRSSSSVDERKILLDFKGALGITLPSWNSSSPCNFTGVNCDSTTGAVAGIHLPSFSLSGTLPFPSLCQLPSLSHLSLPSNRLSGPLPPSLSNCSSLRHLDLAFNSLSGPVPDLSPLLHLRVLNLSDNSLSGPFPYPSLPFGLSVLSIGDNPFDPAPFPVSLLNLTSLSWLYLSRTNLNGRIPAAIGNLTGLVDLELADNFFYGEIPRGITKLTKLYQLELYNNSLTGTIPAGFGALSELQLFDASMNYLAGNLSEVRNLTKIVSLQLFNNNLSGELPPEIGDFRNLENLSLYNNNLSGEIPEKLGSFSEVNFIDLSTNYFTGRIPPDMCRMGTMKKLLVLENRLTGEIPATYGDCKSLLRFRVSNNSLSGVVPPGIWGLPNVNIIDLADNQFEGSVDASIGGAKSLYQLYISDNRFSGELPEEISGASALVTIDTSFNQFSGRIPSSLSELKNLQYLVLKNNSFSGPIPDTLGSCVALNAIDLSRNSLTGPIPASLGRLPSLNLLDLSENQLSGGIPASLSSLKLSQLDLSDNQLTGEVPLGLSVGAFSSSFLRNPGLCSEEAPFLPRCSLSSGGSSDKVRMMVICFLAASVGLLSSLCVAVFLRRRGRRPPAEDWRGKLVSKASWDLKSFQILTFDEKEIIDAIKTENLIGKGGSGNVYRVEVGSASKRVLAVKHIWNTPEDAGGRSTAAMLGRRPSVRSREFEAEVGTLSAIRHVNVVKLYCSITSEDSSLLVYEHLPNGSLWDRLHGPAAEKVGLDWDARYDIAVGAAQGLEYLHHGYERPILHRDVKSSNILLDECFKPRIADFGLSKILCRGKDIFTDVIAGTHGYMAPEYAYTCKVNEKSDVYSFGVVLMELVTGRRPIDEEEFGENKDIVDWVSRRVTSKESVFRILDGAIRVAEREAAVKVLRVAVMCTSRLPAMRPSMRTVVQMLEDVNVRLSISGSRRCKTDKIEDGTFEKA